MMLARFIYSATGFPSGGVLTYTLNLLNFYPLQTRVLKPDFLSVMELGTKAFDRKIMFRWVYDSEQAIIELVTR